VASYMLRWFTCPSRYSLGTVHQNNASTIRRHHQVCSWHISTGTNN